MNGLMTPMPALLTRTCASTPASADATASGLVMSTARGRQVPPCPSISCASDSSSSSERATATMS